MKVKCSRCGAVLFFDADEDSTLVKSEAPTCSDFEVTQVLEELNIEFG